MHRNIHIYCTAFLTAFWLMEGTATAEEPTVASPSSTETAEQPAGIDANAATPQIQNAEVPTTATKESSLKEPAVSTGKLDGGMSAPMETPLPPSVPPSRFGILEVQTSPEGAIVSLGGDSPEFEQRIGTTPLKTEVDPGNIVLVIQLEGYETATAEVDVQAGRTSSMQIKLEKKTARSKKGLRAAGHALFWPGIITAGTGIALIAADDPKMDVNTGMPGFITAGIGTAMVVAGGLILGLTFHDKTPYRMPTVSFAPPSDGKGGGVMLQKSF
jgi:hypothetical protein